MKKRHLILIPVVIASLSLAGCASDSKRVVDLNLKYVSANGVPVQSSDRQAQAQIAEAATSIGGSLQHLQAIKSATHPGVRMGRPTNPNAIGMSHVASINWTGPVGPVVKEIAKVSGYKFRVIGNRPATAVLVNVNARNEPLAYILRNIRYQVVGKASVSVYSRSKTIELRYY